MEKGTKKINRGKGKSEEFTDGRTDKKIENGKSTTKGEMVI